jgi:hypothetical protein
MYGFGYAEPTGEERRKSLVAQRETWATNASDWWKLADKIADYDPRLAARCRDIANALSACATLCGDIARSEGLP